MGIEDRDWYREEYAKKHGRKASHQWGRKKPLEGQTIGDFLENERRGKDDVSHAQEKLFEVKPDRTDKKPKQGYTGVNKREKLKTVPVVKLVRRSRAFVFGSICCFITAVLTLFATLLIANIKPEYLELPIHYTVQLLNLVNRS